MAKKQKQQEEGTGAEGSAGLKKSCNCRGGI